MRATEIPQCFDQTSVVLVENAAAYQRFVEGDRVELQDTVSDYDPEWDFEDLQEGPCLVALDEAIDYFKTVPHHRDYRDSVPAHDPKGFVLSIVESFWIAEFRDGTITRQGTKPLKDLLEARRVSSGKSAPVVPMKDLEQYMCYDGDSTPLSERELDLLTSYPCDLMIQFPGAYKTLYDTGALAGILNRSACDLDCCIDFVWIEEDLCLMWMRSDAALSAEWIRLFPFRVDRTGPPGRLLKELHDKPVWKKFYGLPLVRLHGNTWYDA